MQPFTRVFALAPDCHTKNNPYAAVWQAHFYDGLAAAVAETTLPVDVDFGWCRPAAVAQLRPSVERSLVSERLWQQIRASRVDVVISYCFASDIDVSLVEQTVAAGIPWINFFCDSTYAFDRVEAIARAASLNWFPEHAAEARYAALGPAWLCRPYALNPAHLPEAGCDQAAHDVGFVGAPTGNRVVRLSELWARGCRVEARGNGWRPSRSPSALSRPARVVPGRRSLVERIVVRAMRPWFGRRGPLSEQELPRFLSQCRVVLGLNEGRDVRGTYQSYLKLRDVEFPGYGVCYLTQHNDDVAQLFDIGREILTFRSAAEAKAQVRDCVRFPSRARAMGRAARARVLHEHTWSTRLGELAKAL